MSSSDRLIQIALMGVFTALVYITTSISFPMQPLGVWHMGNLVAFIGAILFGLYLGAFVRAVGAGLFDIWNPLWGSRFVIWGPVTLVIRGLLGFLLLGKNARLENLEPNISGLIAMILGQLEKNVSYFIYDYYLFGAVSFFDLFTLFPKRIVEITIVIGLLVTVRRALGKTYLV